MQVKDQESRIFRSGNKTGRNQDEEREDEGCIRLADSKRS